MLRRPSLHFNAFKLLESVLKYFQVAALPVRAHGGLVNLAQESSALDENRRVCFLLGGGIGK